MLITRTVRASTYIKVPRQLVFAVLASYDSYRDWVPDVLESRLLAAEGDVAITEFVAQAYNGGKFVLEFVASSNDWLMFNQVDRYRRDGLSGRWDLEKATVDSGVVVRASLSMRNSVFKLGSRRQLRQVLDRTLDALASRSLRLAAHGAAGATLGRRKIFELVRTGDALQLDFEGESYDLIRRTGGPDDP
jgi:hypothetical protein